MKDYIQAHYNHVNRPSLNQFRAWVTEAWESITEQQLANLLASIPARIAAVRAAGGYHTGY